MDYSILEKKEILDLITNKLRNDEVFSLSWISEALKDDEDVVLKLIKYYGNELMFASERLKDKEDLVIYAIKENPNALRYVSDRLKNDKELVLLAMKKDILTLKHASNILQNDKELLEILEKVNKYYWNEEGKKWYEERMEILSLFREKELMEKSIKNIDKSSKKIKF